MSSKTAGTIAIPKFKCLLPEEILALFPGPVLALQATNAEVRRHAEVRRPDDIQHSSVLVLFPDPTTPETTASTSQVILEEILAGVDWVWEQD